ncbi:MAG: tetratricopeptide repeat protein [Oligoflexia bacterium]|nr:tetratricopeptide repeat protein [Oligoflexia bacterium]
MHILISLLLFASSPSTAAEPLQGIATTNAGTIRHWKKLPVELCSASNLPNHIQTELQNAISTWNSAFAQPVFSLKCKTNTTDFQKDKPEEHTIFWVTGRFGSTGDPLAIARTLSTFDEDSGELFDADILLNSESFDWSQLRIDPQSVLIHELGHMLGLQHLPISSHSVMHQYPYQSGIIRRKLSHYELEAINRKYFGSNKSIPAHIDAYFRKDFVRAIQLLKNSTNRDAESYYMQGRIELITNKTSHAIDSFKKGIKLDGSNPLIQYALSEAYSKARQLQLAKSTLKGLLKQFPNYYEGHADLGVIQLEEGNTSDAIASLKRAVEINPVHYPACILLFKLTRQQNYKACYVRFAPKDRSLSEADTSGT